MIRASILALLTICCGIIPDAAAEVGTPTPTVQASATNAAWLAYAPPPASPGVVCMIDSGVDPNPDTQTAVIGSRALYPRTDTGDEIARLSPPVQPGNHPDGHGTLMAMLMAAPANNWGMTGIAPTAVRVYNMKALQAGSVNFSDEKEAEGIEACAKLKKSTLPDLSVINLSLAGESSPAPATVSEVDNKIIAVRNQGINVVAAAGNSAGELEFPASYPAVLAIGAADAAKEGMLCAFSARGEGLDLLAPGCDTLTGGIEGAFQDTGEPNVSMGTSQASSLASAVLASMRAYDPNLTMSQSETCLTSTATNGAIDAAAAYQACGLSQIVQAGLTAQAGANSAPAPASSSSNVNYNIEACRLTGSCSSSQPSPEAVGSFEHDACPAPRLVRVRHARNEIRIVVRAAAECWLQARLSTRRRKRTAWLTHRRLAKRALSLHVGAGQKVQIRFMSPTGVKAPSRWLTVPANAKS
jgi:Subtilase family